MRSLKNRSTLDPQTDPRSVCFSVPECNRLHGGLGQPFGDELGLLLEPIKIVREQLGKKSGILNPQKKPEPGFATAYRLHQANSRWRARGDSVPATCCFGWAVTPLHPAR
jgi:hypothetical protein